MYRYSLSQWKHIISVGERICTILDEQVPKATSYKDLITFVEDRAGHDRRYATRTWMETGIEWYLANDIFVCPKG